MRPGYFAALLVATYALLSGCQTTENSAPVVQSLSLSSRRNPSLEHGRDVFLRSCRECHTLQPIRKHSVDRWHEILAIMAPRARLSPDDRAALEAYLVAARRSYSD